MPNHAIEEPDMAAPTVLHADRAAMGARLGLLPSPARLFRTLPDDRVQCDLCPRHCTLSPGRSGFLGCPGRAGG